MKIKYLILSAVLLTAILGFGNVAQAQVASSCISQLSTLSNADQITCLQGVIAQLMAQIQTILAQQQGSQGYQNQTQAGSKVTAGGWCHNFKDYLFVGSNSVEVEDLVGALSKENLFSTASGSYYNFDENLKSAVIVFQAQYGLPQTGTVGPRTRAKLNQFYRCAGATPSENPNPGLGCNNLYWYDSTNTSCQSPRQFCGAFMYYGLHTFSDQQSCLAAVPHTPSQQPASLSTWLPIAGDWDGNRSGVQAIGLYDPTTSIFYLKNANSEGVADITFPFGTPNRGWLPIAGDWNGDGTDTVGLYDPVASQFYLRNSNTSGNADINFGFGTPGANMKPIAGDWNGDGADTIGVYSQASSHFYLRNTNTEGMSDIDFGFGVAGAGWLPVAGRWASDNTTIGLYDPATSKFYLRNINSTGVANVTFGFGTPNAGWLPFAGDWNGDGAYGIGLFDPLSAHFYLRNSNTTGNSDINFGYGVAQTTIGQCATDNDCPQPNCVFGTNCLGSVSRCISGQCVVTPYNQPTIISAGSPGNPTNQFYQGNQVTLFGSGFPLSATIQMDANDSLSHSFMNATGSASGQNLTFTAPAVSAGIYRIYLVDSPGGSQSSNAIQVTVLTSTQCATLGQSINPSLPPMEGVARTCCEGLVYVSSCLPGMTGCGGTCQNPVTQQPTITVTSPNGNENWKVGETHNITWSTQNFGSLNVGLDLVQYNDIGQMSLTNIANNLPNTGSYSWTVPNIISNRLKLLAGSFDVGPTAQDYSDNYFSITAQATTSSVGDTIGLFSPTSLQFYQKYTNTTGSSDNSFGFGSNIYNQLPVAGDWNGDTISTIGLYNPVNSFFYLRGNNSAGNADSTFGFGVPFGGWLPIAGDWDGNKIDTVGLYDPATSQFYLKNSNTSGGADLTFGFGAPGAGWKPIAGDWNNDGTDEVGLYDASTSRFFLRNSATSTTEFAYGAAGAGWLPTAGDWNNDGTDTIGLYDPATSIFFLSNVNTNNAGVADVQFGFGTPGAGWKPIAGKWAYSL